MGISERSKDELLPWKQIVAKSVHDMRTPLSCIRTTLEILRMTSEEGERQSRLLGVLDAQVDELASQLEKLLKSPEEIVHFTTISQGEDDFGKSG